MLQYVWTKLYAGWLRSQLVRERPRVVLRHGQGRNLILGIARNYSIQDLRPFVRSARKFHDCRIVLVIDNNPDLGKALDAEGVDCVLLDVASALGRPHMNFARITDYVAVLQALSGQIDRVFLADTRDVVFQSDIFDALPDEPIIFFEEAHGFALATAGWNGNAIRRTFGEQVFDAIKHHEVICSGTVLARHDIALMYCWEKLLLGQLVDRRHHMRSGVDQATTNVIARVDLVPRSVVMPYDGAVATLSGNNTDFLSVRDGLMRTASGQIPAAIHQYDRNSEVRDFVYATYDGPTAGKAGDRSKDSTLQKKLRITFGLQGP
ncbi:hypothetical protein [Hyphomicrobium sp.]|uniref:hypothetical protein n=1 Tax=Hyphomicrobium sp. TaxID=82 RepID=UPI000FAE4C29|nr:hypothetical protein [Hyphomicrobium sp.]RUO97536.1 MAG: hypothetical protein EKK30_16210 [Hyphomicrobium sp.]